MGGRRLWRFVIICRGLFTCECCVYNDGCMHYVFACYECKFVAHTSLFHQHSYELVPTSKNNNNEQIQDKDDTNAKNTCSQFTLRRMACFGSPRYDRREPLHILSADSRFPDVEPKRIRRVGNHFLALFPVTNKSQGVIGGGLGLTNLQFRNHALLRGGSRIVPSAAASSSSSPVDEVKEEVAVQTKRKKAAPVVQTKRKKAAFKWDGGRGKWANDDNEVDKQ